MSLRASRHLSPSNYWPGVDHSSFTRSGPGFPPIPCLNRLLLRSNSSHCNNSARNTFRRGHQSSHNDRGRLARTLQSRYLIPYISLEILGGILAGVTLRIGFPSTSSSTNLGSTRLSAGIYPILGMAIEASGTFVLTISALVATSYVRSHKGQALLVGSNSSS
jgi:hypothetical protein